MERDANDANANGLFVGRRDVHRRGRANDRCFFFDDGRAHETAAAGGPARIYFIV